MFDESADVESGGKYLTFKLGEEPYGVDILQVQEIIGLLKITRIPHTPSFIRGVVNLRGRVIPVISLRARFGLEPKESTNLTCIVVVQVQRAAGESTMGVIVDEVAEVLDIPLDCIDPCPPFGGTFDLRLIRGMAKVDGKVVILLDIDRVLNGEELDALGRIPETLGA